MQNSPQPWIELFLYGISVIIQDITHEMCLKALQANALKNDVKQFYDVFVAI